MKGIQTVYQAPTAEQAVGRYRWESLLLVQEQWGKSVSTGSSRLDGQLGVVICFFRVPAAVRKVMYTTNTVEGHHQELRKITKTKGVFSSDVALQKLVYLVIQNLERNRAGVPVGNKNLQLEGGD